MPVTGVVKSFNDVKGWGFVDVCGVDVFVHINNCLEGQPQVGDVLSFDMEKNPTNESQPQAKNIRGGTGIRADLVNKQLIMSMIQGGCQDQGQGEEQRLVGAWNGVVKAWHADQGFGFVVASNGLSIFLHASDCKGGNPVPGDEVRFDIEEKLEPDGTISKRARNISGGHIGIVNPATSAIGAGGSSTMAGSAVSSAPEKPLGRIQGLIHSWIDEKGWGFASIPGCRDIFVHTHHCEEGYRPKKNELIEFEMQQGRKKDGTPNFEAVKVTKAPPGAQPSNPLAPGAGGCCGGCGNANGSASKNFKRNANGHLLGCVCASCTQICGTAPNPGFGPMRGGMMGCGPAAMAGPYSGGPAGQGMMRPVGAPQMMGAGMDQMNAMNQMDQMNAMSQMNPMNQFNQMSQMNPMMMQMMRNQMMFNQ